MREQFAAAPAWLLELIADDSSGKGKPLEHWHYVLTNTIANGPRNMTLASVCGKLMHAGLTDMVLLYDVMLCVNTARCQLPLPPPEVQSIVASVARSHLRKLRSDE